ncbi:hypothetical protein E2C01_071389 [Portunus trituberculatus]|uniref:Uncharacterized protein n=1 Tax=Portunus trituberculatus TaxID=210409 RepID=A0A5B7HZU8_PORTR|nr:hypothetical protein [Portunus trituberculatus]
MKKTNGGEGAISTEKERKTLDELKGKDVCGYRHPLPTSSNKQTLVKPQLLKHCQLFSQRETAAAANWFRIIQFFFPKDTANHSNKQATPLADLARERLSRLNRYFVEIVSKPLRGSIPCERVYNDITTKFNSDILTLGREPGYFLKNKTGLVIQDHARQAAELAVHNHLQFHPGSKSSRPSHEKVMETCSKFALEQAHQCVIAREHGTQYERDRPFLPTEHEPRFNPIPFFGVENPIYPEIGRAECVDNTATRGTDQHSSFWLKETNGNFTEALVSRSVLSEVALSSNNLSEIVSSKDAICPDLYRRLRDINHNELASNKPRKYDTMPWSSKNTGQTGIKDIFLAGVESQRAMAQNDIMYSEKQTINGVAMINAPDISPVYRHADKPASISLKHTTCINKK